MLPPVTLDQVKQFPDKIGSMIKALSSYVEATMDSTSFLGLDNSLLKLKKTFNGYKSIISSFCLNISEQTFANESTSKSVEIIEGILGSCQSIQILIDSNRYDALPTRIESIIEDFVALSDALRIEFFKAGPVNNTNIHMLNVYHDMALKIKSDSESNPLTTGKILSSIQASIDKLQITPASNPFMAVVGPSFMGKTQLAFILALLQPIIYINFSGGQQPVYSLFSHLANEILNILRLDLKDFDLNHVGTFGPGSDALNGVYKYKKYGILGCIMAMYEKCASLDFTDANFNWMKFYTELGSFTFVKLSISEFVEKKNALFASYPNMKKPVLFIDEFVKVDSILFLRSLAYCVQIPCILASTNAKISNMIAFYNPTSSVERFPWCNVVTRLPPCAFEGIISVLKVSDNVPLATCFDGQVLNVDSLLARLNIQGSEAMKRQIESIFNLLRAQSSTCLQGIAFIAVEKLLDILRTYREGMDIWAELIQLISIRILERKTKMKSLESLFFSLSSFSLTLPVTFVDDTMLYSEGPASYSVNENLYYFGERRDDHDDQYNPITALNRIGQKLKTVFADRTYEFKSYLPNFDKDVITHMALWNLIRAADPHYKEKITVAKVLEQDYERKKFPFNVKAISKNHNFQEQLALLAAACASQQSANGDVDGVSFFKEFVTQCQIVSAAMEIPSESLLCDLIITDVPLNLRNFLIDIKVPYFVPQAYTIPFIEPLVRTGICQRNENRDGVDLSFEIINREAGHIECKNLKAKVARGLAMEYIIRAMKKRSPLTILLANEAGESLRSREDFNAFYEPSSPETSEPGIDSAASNLANLSNSQSKKKKNKKPKVAKVVAPKPKRITHSFIEELNKQKVSDSAIPLDFDLNIYSLVHSPNSDGALQLDFIVLHEIPSPQGVFVIIESNANFSS